MFIHNELTVKITAPSQPNHIANTNSIKQVTSPQQRVVVNMSMKYIAAYFIAALSGAKHPGEEIEKIIKSVGGEVDDKVLSGFINAIKDKQPHELISAGLGKLQTISMSSASVSAAAPATVHGGATAEPEKKEEEEEEDDDMGFSLFD